MTQLAEFGDVIDVNTQEMGEQIQSDVTALAGGSFVVVWLDVDPIGDSSIYSQMYNSSGESVGANVVITTGPDLAQPLVSELSDGGYVIVWVANETGQLADDQIMAKRFDVSGTAVGVAIEIDSPVDQESRGIDLIGVSAVEDGGYVLAWQALDAGFEIDVFQVIDGNDVATLAPAQSYRYGNSIDWTGSLDNQLVSNSGESFAVAQRQIEDFFMTFPIVFRIFDTDGNQIFQRFFEQTDGAYSYARSIKIEALSDGSFAVIRTLVSGGTSQEETMDNGTVLVIYGADGTVVLDDTYLSQDNDSLLNIVALDGSFIVKLASETTATQYSNDGVVLATGIVVPDGFLNSESNFNGLTANVFANTDSDGGGVDLQFFTAQEATMTSLSTFGPQIDVNTDETGAQTRSNIAVL